MAGRGRHGILAPFRHPRLQVGEVWIEVAAARPAHSARWEALGTGILANCREGQAGGEHVLISADIGSRGNREVQCVTALISVETYR